MLSGRIFRFLVVPIILFSAFTCNADVKNLAEVSSDGKAPIPLCALGRNVFDLYRECDFRIIEKYTEFADLPNEIEFWLAIDGSKEYVVLQTYNQKITEIRIQNPGFVTARGLSTGQSKVRFFALYPNAIRIKNPENKVAVPAFSFFVESEGLWVEFDEKTDSVWEIRVTEKTDLKE